MNQHLRQVHGKEKPNNDTETMARIQPESENNRESSKLNSEEFKYECKDCGRCFRLRCTLTAHRTIHSNERPHECWMCHRS